MKTILDEFERKTIQVHGEYGLESVTVWCYGELYIGQCWLDEKPMWHIGCVPLGLMFPEEILGYYKDIESGCMALKEMARINNSWASLTGFGPKEMKQMTEIAEKFGGFRVLAKSASGEYGHVQPENVHANMNGATQS